MHNLAKEYLMRCRTKEGLGLSGKWNFVSANNERTKYNFATPEGNTAMVTFFGQNRSEVCVDISFPNIRKYFKRTGEDF
jgi:hypothetical protein